MLSKKALNYFKKNGYSYEEIEGIKRGLNDIKNGKVYTEEEFYSRLEKKLLTSKEVNV